MCGFFCNILYLLAWANKQTKKYFNFYFQQYTFLISYFSLFTTSIAIGFNVETINFNNIKLQVWDLGGQTSIRPYWRCYYANTDAIIYVIDSCDHDRLGIAKTELFAMLEEEELKDATLLVFANKQDLPNALSDEEISNKLGLSKIKNRQWTIFKTSAVNGTGLTEGLDWLCKNISSAK